MLAPIHSRLAILVSRVMVRRVDDAGAIQLMQLDGLDSQTMEGVEVFGAYGFAYNPPDGAEAIVAGASSRNVVLGLVHRASRLRSLAKGEAAIFDDQGQVVYLKRDGIHVVSPLGVKVEAPEVDVTANSVSIDADDVTFSGNVHVEGDFSFDGDGVLGEGATKHLKLEDDTISTKVKAK